MAATARKEGILQCSGNNKVAVHGAAAVLAVAADEMAAAAVAVVVLVVPMDRQVAFLPSVAAAAAAVKVVDREVEVEQQAAGGKLKRLTVTLELLRRRVLQVAMVAAAALMELLEGLEGAMEQGQRVQPYLEIPILHTLLQARS